MRRFAFALLPAALLCFGCTPPAAAPDAQQAAAEAGCAVSVTTPWRPLSGIEFQTIATSAGADCAQANATLRISYGQDQTLYTETFPTANVMVLAPAHDPEAMRTALTGWLDQSNAMMPTTGRLPDWPEGAAAPVSGEFPFYVEEGVDRAAYMAIRDANAPMFCFVQGMESMACLGWRDSVMMKIGVQSFPG